MSWPVWLSRPGGQPNLREVAPRLCVGAFLSGAESAPQNEGWALVVNLHGLSGQVPYNRAQEVVEAPFEDGTPFPAKFLDRLVPRIIDARHQGDCLLHCAAGLSRSASLAYAVLRLDDKLGHATALSRVSVPGAPGRWPHPAVLHSVRLWLIDKL